MTQNYAIGTTFTQTAKVIAASAEFTTGNNSALATGIVQALPDLRITKILAPFTGYHQGDEVRYTISYGNSWGKSADNVSIVDTMNGQVTLNTNNFSIGTLPAGSGWTIILTWTLAVDMTSWMQFINTANITTTNTEAITGNNTSIATGTVQGRKALDIVLTINNLTRPQLENAPYGSWPTTMIQAASGDIVQFTITYTNNGNVVITHATLHSTWHQANFTTLNPINGTIPNVIDIDESATVSMTGVVWPKNYISFSVYPYITHDIGQTVSGNTVRIVEPFVCGDGIITRTEPCDTLGNVGVLYSGQVCENQQGVCILKTQSIINNACITYQYPNPAGGVFTWQACSSVNAALANASCVSMQGSAPQTTNNGYTINYICTGSNTTATTPITINCGNGTNINWLGASLSGTCTYAAGFNGTAQCSVGSDINNAACRWTPSSNQYLCDLEPLDGTVIIMDNDEGEWEFRCHTHDYQPVNEITIDCWEDGEADNGNQRISINNASELETTCSYEDVGTLPEERNVQCFINDNAAACEDEDIILDEGTFGRCGDGEVEGYEECDIENMEEDRTYNREDSQSCRNCKIVENVASVGCFNVAGMNISVQENEYLPFRWAVDGDYKVKNACDEDTHTANSIKAGSLICTFSITDSNDDVVDTIETPCKNSNNQTIFNYFSTIAGTSFDKAYGKYTALLSDDIIERYGEYKLSLDEVNYEYCGQDGNDREWKEGTPIKRVCESNFTVTKPYLIQKSSFGITPKTTNNVDLDDFRWFDGKRIVSSTELDKIMIIEPDEDYKWGNSIVTMMDDFITKYEKVAVKYKSIKTIGWNADVYKVPGQDILIFKWDGTLPYNEWSTKTKPFTVIVDGPHLQVNGNITNTNAMFLVNKWNIAFTEDESARCKWTQTVKGIFVTKNRLIAAGDYKNDNISQERCPYGGLKIQGILIGNGIEDMVQSRRSQLNHRFLTKSSALNAINTERRNEIFDGAAILIEHSPSLRSALPPGASDFTKALDVYKK
jgi:hypothetical protein